MHWFRRGVVGLLSLVLLVALVGGALSISSNIAFTHPDKIEAWLDQSHFYDNLITNELDQAQKSVENSSGAGQVSLNDPAVRQAAQTALSPQLLRQDVTSVLNSNYAWLEGKTATPNFNIDLSDVKQSFADHVGQAAQARVAGLPACSRAQLQQLAATSQNIQSTDPFKLPCLPPGFNTHLVAPQISQDVMSNHSFIGGNENLTASNLNSTGTAESKPYYQRLSAAPTLYKFTVALPWVYALLAVVSLLGIVFLAASKCKGVRRIGIIFFIAGLIMIAAKFVTDTSVPHVESHVLSGMTGPLHQSLTLFLHFAETQLVKVYLWFGIAYLVVSAMMLVYVLSARKRAPQRVAQPAPASTPTTQTPQSTKPTRPNPPRLIQ